jgi:hypothetical protein
VDGRPPPVAAAAVPAARGLSGHRNPPINRFWGR